MRRSKFDKDVMISAVQEYLDGESSQRAIENRLGIRRGAFRQWIKKYQTMGTDALGGHKNKRYSKEMKEQAVRDYIEYYNTQRLQRNLDVLTPMEKHNNYLAAA